MVQSVHQPTRYLMKVDSEMGELRAFTFISEASFNCQMTRRSAAASRWAGYSLAHPEFGSSVNPITTRGVDYAHHITARPPGFENPAASL